MTPLQYLLKLGLDRPGDTIGTDDGAFPTMTDPSAILDYMDLQSIGQRRASGDGAVARIPFSGRSENIYDPYEAQRARMTRGAAPTLWGSIMQKRHGGIQGRGIAGSLGKAVNPRAGSPSLQQFQDEALDASYPMLRKVR